MTGSPQQMRAPELRGDAPGRQPVIGPSELILLSVIAEVRISTTSVLGAGG